jgi:hypothetical protein
LQAIYGSSVFFYVRQLLLALLGVTLLGGAGAQQPSSQNQTDLLQQKIASAAKVRDYQHVLSLLDEYRRLQLPAVTAYYYLEAIAAYHTGQRARALSAAASYLNAPDGQAFHAEALTLYNTIQEEDRRKAKN